jgi:hypothetical protein
LNCNWLYTGATAATSLHPADELALLLLLLQGYSTPQTTVYYLLSYGSSRTQLLPKYVAFARAFNEDSSTPATLLWLAVIVICHSCVWWLGASWIWRIVTAAG